MNHKLTTNNEKTDIKIGWKMARDKAGEVSKGLVQTY